MSNTDLNVEDVLFPRLEWIDGGCYRVDRKVDADVVMDQEKKEEPKIKSYDDNEDFRCEGDNDDYEIETTENGRFKTYIKLPVLFFSYIIGTKGFRRKKLEEETRTEISIPKPQKGKKITISGPNERSIVTARRKLEMIAFDLRNKHQITHFISFPLVSDEIKTNFKKFKESVLALGHIDGVEESIFQKVDKIHLTIGTMVLLDNDEIDNANDILEGCKREVIRPLLASKNITNPLLAEVKGLEYMNDDPGQVDVLYAKVQIKNDPNNDILQELSDQIVQYFYRHDLVKYDQGEHVKLHATLINTRYRKDSESGSRSRQTRRIAFDAQPILEKLSNFEFGIQQLDSIHLSHRFSVDKSGYYEPVSNISID